MLAEMPAEMPFIKADNLNIEQRRSSLLAFG